MICKVTIFLFFFLMTMVPVRSAMLNDVVNASRMLYDGELVSDDMGLITDLRVRTPRGRPLDQCRLNWEWAFRIKYKQLIQWFPFFSYLTYCLNFTATSAGG